MATMTVDGSFVVLSAPRYHPHGHTIYDVYVGGKRAGCVTHPREWVAYPNNSDEVIGTAATRKAALSLLVAHVKSP